MKKKYFFIAALILIITSIFSTNAMATNDLNNDIIKTEKQSNIEYNKLLKTYNKTNGYIDPSKIDYPDYYAGAYLNEDKELVVLVTDDNLNNKKEMKTITQNENLIIKSAKYTYDYLNTTLNKISDYLIANQESDDTLYSAIQDAAVYDDKNYILVHLEDEMTKQSSFLKIQ